MTCGKWGQPGHETHLCTDCTEMWHDCPACRLGKACNFRLAMPEILKKRDEIFSRKMVMA